MMAPVPAPALPTSAPRPTCPELKTTNLSIPAVPSSKKSQLFAGGPYVRFNLGSIDHPVYGKADFCGDIPLLLPFRGYTKEEILPDLAGCDKIAVDLIHVGRAVWPDDDDEEILTKLQEYAFSCAVMSGMSSSHPRLPLFVYPMVLFMNFDDQLDKLDDFAEMTGSYKDFLADCREADPFMDRPIPSATADMARMLTCWDALKAKWLEVPDYRAKQEVHLFLASHLIQSELRKQGLEFSEKTKYELLRNISSPASVAEFVAILRDVSLPGYVRRDVLFAVARDKLSDVEMLTNALFGLPRDIKLGQRDSPIMYDVTTGRRSLQAAIEKVHADLVDALHDLKLATNMLLCTYPDDENVAKYGEIVVGGMDGMLYSYKFVERYRLGDKLKLFEK